MSAPIYLDHMATTPLDAVVRRVMDEALELGPANPHASTHAYGWAAARAVEDARTDVASLIGAKPAEIVFTSGATEACNLALIGGARASPRRRIVVSSIEHPCVLEAAAHLEREGYEVEIVPVDGSAVVDLDAIASVVDDRTAIVSVMLANNETATIEPIGKIGALCRERGVLLHTDAAQAAGRIAMDVDALQVDFLSLSAHKMYGPMGIGALYVRTGTPVARQLHGGAQQGGLRGGTVPTPLAVGFGRAAGLARERLSSDSEHLFALADSLWQGLSAAVPDAQLVAGDATRLPGCFAVRVPGVSAEDWLLASPEIAASTGAACASADQRPSHVMRALGLSAEEAASVIRISLGRSSTEGDVGVAVSSLLAGVRNCRD